ncbi:hypothetical protein G6F63_016943 [Rhizopus arrhizus]|nr:hypothetical protein G6F63_016943 [Rhizopus arrhizus]
MAGGAMLGYWETGNCRMDSAPAIISTIAITQAKTGLSIKNFAMHGSLITAWPARRSPPAAAARWRRLR